MLQGVLLSDGLGGWLLDAKDMNMKWFVFDVLWVTGLLVGDVLAASSMGGTGSRLVFFGGTWMLVCLGAKEFIADYQEAKASSKPPNVEVKALAEGKSP